MLCYVALAVSKLNERVQKYKEKIKSLQKTRDFHESEGRSGACISITGEIQAYNAVIKDLERL